MSGLERLKFKCECHHADGIIRMTRDQLRGIIEQIEQEANHPVQAGSSYRITFYDRLVLGWVEAHGGLDEIKKGQEIAEGYKECLNGVCRRLGLTDGSGMPEMPEVIYSEIGRAAQDSENRRAELCSSLGIDLETGWGDAMVEMRSRLMPTGYEWPRYADREPVLVGDAVAVPLGNMIVEAVEFSKTGVTGRVLADLKDGKDGDWITSKRVQLGDTVCRARPVHLDSGEDDATGKSDGWERLEDESEMLRQDISVHLGDYSPSNFRSKGDSVQERIVDLMRRAKELHERELAKRDA